ncbi:adp-ribosylation factor [Stylonychia lemnae]|uniref:Adp-ribosylation factor n=1 Tax=Stylonychia lemnae TaxID=5949 RepID=A0A078AJM5_STYLE|nr:adp-ribosylation factor [Stylonychia lemnae]|eukprot:CDW81008.1 adp-ribosylation factor [Stylonychia lemnae]
MVGLDRAGKTSILYDMRIGLNNSSTISTMGSNLWVMYSKDCNCIIYVVDSIDRDRIEEASSELFRILEHKEFKSDACLLVFANKQDLPLAMTPDEIAYKMNLNQIKDMQWHVQKCSAITGEGLVQGFEWISETLKKSKKST